MKKGELTSKQIVAIVILIVSFAVILIFFFALDLRSEINSETCRNSVILRGTELGKNTRLNCQTEDVCFSRDGSCDVGLQDTRVIEVNSKNEFLDEASDLMYDCYWQMGSGEVDYTPKNVVGGNYCAICNRIYFDESLEGTEITDVSNLELYSYLKGKRVPNGDNNLLFEMYKVNNIGSIFVQLQESYDESYAESYGGDVDIADLPAFTGDNSVLITGIFADGALTEIAVGILGGGAIVGGILLAVPSFGTSVTLIGAGAGALIGGGGGFILGGEDFNSLPPSYFVSSPEVLEKLNCKEFSTLS